MTFVTAVLGSLFRAVVVTAFVLAVSRQWSRRLNHVDPRWRGALWTLLLAPGLVPELLLGYAYAPRVLGWPVLTEIVCSILLALRLLPVGVIAWQLTPPSPLSPSAWYLRRLTRRDRQQTRELLRCWWVGPIRSTIPAAALVGLLAFQEFELAGLLKAVSWTDWLFTAKQMGQPFADLAYAAIVPAGLQIAVIAAALICLRSGIVDRVSTPEGSQTVAGGRSAAETTGPTANALHPEGMPEALTNASLAPLRGASSAEPQPGGIDDAQPPATVCDPFGIDVDNPRTGCVPLAPPVSFVIPTSFSLKNEDTGRASGTQRFVTFVNQLISPWLWSVLAWGLLVLMPLSSLAWGLPAGIVQLAGQPLRWQGLLRELLGGCAVCVAAACAAWMLAAGVPPAVDRGLRRGWAVLIGVACLPGLSGSLVLSLGMLTLFQRSLLSGLYYTPLMWVLASMLFLLPRGVLLRLWLQQADGSAMTIAQNLSASHDASQRRAGRTLLWRLRDEPRFLAVCFLAYASYLELTLAVLLAPTGLPSGLVRLYNFIHFGRTAALSAEMTVLLGVPLLVAAVVWGLARKGRV